MAHDPLSPEELEALRRWPTPAISNAIERFNIRPRHHGFTGPDIRCMFPEMPPIVGYASTALILAEQPATASAPSGNRTPAVGDYWDFILTIPAPRVAVRLKGRNPRSPGCDDQSVDQKD